MVSCILPTVISRVIFRTRTAPLMRLTSNSYVSTYGLILYKIIAHQNLQTYLAAPVAYLEFQKRGGKYSLATSDHTRERGKPSFPIFVLCKKTFVAKGGTMADLAKG